VLRIFQPGESGQFTFNPARHFFNPILIIDRVKFFQGESGLLNKKEMATVLQAMGWPAKKGFKNKIQCKRRFCDS
jgi:hypothetical protein